MASKGTIVVAGSLAQCPHRGGHAWVFLQYVLGFRRLGYDVLFLDKYEPPAHSDGNRYLLKVAGQFGLAGSVALARGDGRFIGMDRSDVLERVRRRT